MTFGLLNPDPISSFDLKVKSPISHYLYHNVFMKIYCKHISQKFTTVLPSCFCLLKVSLKFIQSSFLYPGLTSMITYKLFSEESDNIRSKMASIVTFIYIYYENSISQSSCNSYYRETVKYRQE